MITQFEITEIENINNYSMTILKDLQNENIYASKTLVQDLIGYELLEQ